MKTVSLKKDTRFTGWNFTQKVQKTKRLYMNCLAFLFVGSHPVLVKVMLCRGGERNEHGKPKGDNMNFAEAVIELFKLKGEVPKHTIIILGRLAGLTEKQVRSQIKEWRDQGLIYVTRREDIFKLT